MVTTNNVTVGFWSSWYVRVFCSSCYVSERVRGCSSCCVSAIRLLLAASSAFASAASVMGVLGLTYCLALLSVIRTVSAQPQTDSNEGLSLQSCFCGFTRSIFLISLNLLLLEHPLVILNCVIVFAQLALDEVCCSSSSILLTKQFLELVNGKKRILAYPILKIGSFFPDNSAQHKANLHQRKLFFDVAMGIMFVFGKQFPGRVAVIRSWNCDLYIIESEATHFTEWVEIRQSTAAKVPFLLENLKNMGKKKVPLLVCKKRW